MLKIALVDDHLLFRKSLSLLINSYKKVKVVLQAENGEEFLEKLKGKYVDIVLLDIQMPVMNGFETCKILHEKFPRIKILIVSQLTTRECIHKAMELGAHGYFPKNADPDELETAIRSLQDTGFYHGMALSEVMKEAIVWEKNNPLEPIDVENSLSDREIEVIRLACKGYSSNEISEALCIGVRTVEKHRTNIMIKTKTKNFIGVMLFTLKHQLLHLEDL